MAYGHIRPSSRFLLLILLLCSSFGATAEPLRLRVVLSSTQPYYQQTADALFRHTDTSQQTSNVLSASEFKDIEKNHYNVTVAIGTLATKKVLEKCQEEPVLSIFIPKATFETIINQRQSCATEQLVSAIYLDQPISRFLDLTQQVKPEAKTLGVVLGPASAHLLPSIKALAAQRGLLLNETVISTQKNPIAQLRPIMTNSDVVLPLPDEGAINRAVAKWILNLSFQSKTPVIGFSRAYTEAGAVASVFSSPKDIGRHAGELITKWHHSGDDNLWVPQFPKNFTLHTNTIVSRSLNIPLEPAAILKLRIKEIEAAR